MYISTHWLKLAAFFATALSSGIPVVVSPGLNSSTNPNVTSHISPCTNLTDAPTSYCYTKLQETAHLTNWNLTSPELCAPWEMWSTCYMRSVYEPPFPNCTTLSNRTCRQQYNCSTLSTLSLTPSSTASSDTTTNSSLCPSPRISNTTSLTNATAEEAEAFYGAYNIWAVQHHISIWASALNANTSQIAIRDAVRPRVPNNASSVLTTLISKHGLNTAASADAALIGLLGVPTDPPEQSYGNVRLRGESSTLTPVQWQGKLVARLAQALGLAMGEFEPWLDMVEGGAFSAKGLASVEAVVGSLKNGTATGVGAPRRG